MDSKHNIEQARQALRRSLRIGAWVILGLLALAGLVVTAAASWLVSKGLLDTLARLLQGGGA